MVIIPVGQEPENIKKRLNTLFAKLNEAYPDKVIRSLQKDHKKWAETVTELYRLLGYDSGNSFLQAYGYSVERAAIGGRPANDHMAIIEELQRRYPNGSGFRKVNQLIEANPDLASKFKTLNNNANKLFGKSLGDYLKEIGLLGGEASVEDKTEMIARDRQRLEEKIEELKKRYAGKGLPTSVSQLKYENQDLKISAIDVKIRDLLGENPVEYLQQCGLLGKKKVSEPEPKLKSKVKADSGFSFYEKSFVTTLLEPSQEDHVKEIVMQRGGSVKGSVSKNTSYLITIPGGPHETVKYRRAIELKKQGIPIQIITYEEFLTKAEQYDKTPTNQIQGFLIAGTILQGYKGQEASIVIPEGITTIAANAFYNNGIIESVTFPYGLEIIDKHAFGNCTRLRSISLPDSLVTIGAHAFDGCWGLTELRIPDSVTTIQAYAFSNCAGLTEVSIPSSVKKIGQKVFSSCQRLKEIHFPDNITEIPNGVVAKCKMIQRIELPESVISIGNEAFSGTSISRIALPPQLRVVGSSAFAWCSSLRSVALSSTLTEVGDGAFANCEELKEIVFPQSVVHIGPYAFWECTSLKAVSLPSGIAVLDEGVFGKCRSLSDVEVASETISFEKWAFWDCNQLKSIRYKRVKKIGEGAFKNCTKLESITLTKGLTSIGKEAFSGCGRIEEIHLCSGVRTIGAHAFENCKSLLVVDLPEGLKSIGDYAFANCTALTPESFTVINDD